MNNKGTQMATYEFLWLPRGEDNSQPLASGSFSLGAGRSAQYPNAVESLFGLEPDSLGAFYVASTNRYLIAMSRTYNTPSPPASGTFGQALPGIQSDQLIPAGQRRRIIFMSEGPETRANVGCVNGTHADIRVNLELFNSMGTSLEVVTLDLPPRSNDQINRIFDGHDPVNGYVDVWTDTPGAVFYCYGSVLDNVTSDPTTILPQ